MTDEFVTRTRDSESLDAARRLQSCVEAWPECATGEYDPRCCRFPKSCSCTVYDPEHVSESDLEPSRPSLIAVCYRTGRSK